MIEDKDRIAYSIAEAAKACSLSRETIYRRIKDGSLAAVKLGGRTLVRRAALEAMLDRAEAA